MPFLGTTGGGSVKQYGGQANLGYFIKNSLRFRSGASGYLSRTPASASNRKTFTFSFWMKLGALGTTEILFSAGTGGSDSSNLTLGFSANQFTCGFWNFSPFLATQLFRDPAAWYHIVVAFDTTQATATNRVLPYINGQLITAITTDDRASVTQNMDLAVNSNTGHNIGRNIYGSNYYFDGYLSEFNFVDGQQLTPSSFGKTDAATGQWIPKKFAGTYGTNGYYLKFADASAATAAAIGKDSSGNGNNWTPSGISVTSGATYDAMIDSPTLSAVASNYCVMNPLDNTLGGNMPTFFAGNLSISFGNAAYNCKSNFGVSGTGKYYFEVSGTNAGGITNTISFPGVVNDSGSTWGVQIYNGDINSSTGASAYDATAYGSGAWPVIGFAFDLASGKFWIRNDSGWYGSGDPATGANAAYSNLSGTITPYWSGGGGGYSGEHYFNFGQRPFAYTPPTGFKSLNTYNLP